MTNVANECRVSVVVVGEMQEKHGSFIAAYETVYRADAFFFNFSTKMKFLFSVVQCYV